jgi:hypothetical protein
LDKGVYEVLMAIAREDMTETGFEKEDSIHHIPHYQHKKK